MAIALPPDFSEFLQSLNSNQVRYLLVGGYAINYYGYSRNTQDLDVWVAVEAENAQRIATALQAFGFSDAAPRLFLEAGQVIRMGVPPMRIEILTNISGVEFEACYRRRQTETIAGVEIPVICWRIVDQMDVERLQRKP